MRHRKRPRSGWQKCYDSFFIGINPLASVWFWVDDLKTWYAIYPDGYVKRGWLGRAEDEFCRLGS